MQLPLPYDTLTWIPEEEVSDPVACRGVGRCDGVVLGCIVNSVNGGLQWTSTPASTDTILHGNVYRRSAGVLVHNLNSQRQAKLYIKDRGFVATNHATLVVLDEYIRTVGTLDSVYTIDKASSTASFSAVGKPLVTFPSWKLLVAHILQNFELDVFHDLEYRADVVCPGIYELPSEFFDVEEQ